VDTMQPGCSLDSSTEYVSNCSLRDLNSRLITGRDTWNQLKSCPVCDSRSLAKFATFRHFSYSRCRTCGLTFANPVPSDKVLDAFYNSPFYRNYRRLEANRIAQDQYFSISMYRDIRQLASWLDGNQSLNLLDFGCGPGAFLALLRDEFGFENVEGLELSQISVDFARRQYGLTVASSAAELQQQSYDVVLLIEVIEHLPNPAEIFSQLSQLVKPGGLLMITTPSVDSLLGRHFPSLCMHYTAPSHISLFTKHALSHLLSRFGFEIARIETDDCYLMLERVARLLTYELDFVSPQHDRDNNDALYTPNGVGRLLGFRPQRTTDRGRFGRALQRVDQILMNRFWCRVPRLPKTDHLYVLARKRD